MSITVIFDCVLHSEDIFCLTAVPKLLYFAGRDISRLPYWVYFLILALGGSFRLDFSALGSSRVLDWFLRCAWSLDQL